jgi:hypothetical protein
LKLIKQPENPGKLAIASAVGCVALMGVNDAHTVDLINTPLVGAEGSCEMNVVGCWLGQRGWLG